MKQSCYKCNYFIVEASELENQVKGLNIVSSAYGSVRADTGLCSLHEAFVINSSVCANFTNKNFIKINN